MQTSEAIFCAIYEGRPTPGAADAAAVGGASITCWVRAPSKEAASAMARRAIEKRKWAIVEIDRPWFEITEATVPPESKKYLDQARFDGECYVFHTWNNLPDDGAAAH